MADLRPVLFDFYKKGALEGYLDDAENALDVVVSCIADSNMPDNVKQYAREELLKIRSQKDAQYVFHIKKKGKGRRPEKSFLEKNLEIARLVHDHKYSAEPELTDEAAIFDVVEYSDGRLKEGTVRTAYYDHKEQLEFEMNYRAEDFL